MIEELQVKVRRIRPIFILLVLVCPLVAGAQEVSSSGNTGEMPSEALGCLNQVLERYPRASTYHIGTVEEHELAGPFRRSWDGGINTASAAHGNRDPLALRPAGV